MKKIIRTCLLIMMLTGLCTQVLHVGAKESFQISYPAKVRCDIGFENSTYFEVGLTDKTDVIKNLKFSGKNLKGFVTGYYYFEDAEEACPYAEITFYAKKKGNYKITFSIYNQEGKKLKDCSIQVKAMAGYYSSSPIKKMTIDGKKCSLSGPLADSFPHCVSQRWGNPRYSDLEEPYYYLDEAVHVNTIKDSAAVKFTLRSGLKIKEVKAYQYDADKEDYVLREFTNGKSISFKQSMEGYGTVFVIIYTDSFDKKDYLCQIVVHKDKVL